MQATPAIPGKETSDEEAMEGYDTSAPGGVAGADAAVTVASFFLLAPLPRASGPSPPARKRSRSNVSTRYLTRPSPGSGRPAMASSIVALLVARFLEAEASLPRRSWRASLQVGDEIMALTLLPTASETPRTGARGATYAAAPGVEHLLAQEPTLLLLDTLPAAAAGVFLDVKGTGGEPEPHFLATLPPAPAPPRTASSGAS